MNFFPNGGATRTVCIACLGFVLLDKADAATVDATYGSATGADAAILVVVTQPDGSAIVGGVFATYAGVARRGLARVTSTGAFDASYDAQLVSIPNSGVFALANTSQGLLAGGAFTSARGVIRAGLARLQSTGALDAGFVPALVAPSVVSALLADDDGVYVGGTLYLASSPNPVALVRLNANGSLDSSFAPPAGVFDTAITAPVIVSLKHDARGRLVVGGAFRLSATGAPGQPGTGLFGLVRFRRNGAVDATLPRSAALVGSLKRIFPEADGRVLVAGEFAGAAGNGGTRGIARLHPDGSLDTDFTGSVGQSESEIYAVECALPLPTGHVLVCGDFLNIGATSQPRLAFLHRDGSLDAPFGLATAPNGAVNDAALDANGGVLVVGDFSQIGGQNRRRLARLLLTTPATDITRLTGPTTAYEGSNAILRASAVGVPPLTYSWARDGVIVQTGPAPALALAGVAAANAGQYTVTASATGGSSDSASLTLAVVPRAAGGADTLFVPSFTDSNVSVAVAENGSVLLGTSSGSQRIPGTVGLNPIRLTAVGAVDLTFPWRGGGFSTIVPRAHGGAWVTGNNLGTLGLTGLIGRLDASLERVDPTFQIPAALGLTGIGPVAPTASGGLVLAGANSGANKILAILRAGGSMETAFNNGQPVVYTNTSTAQEMVAATEDHWVYFALAGVNTVQRYRPAGTLDASWSFTGAGARPLFTGFDGRVYLIGSLSGGSVQLRRVGVNGAFDPAFNPPNAALWELAAADVFGRVVGIYNGGLVRLQPDGSQDTGFAQAALLSASSRGRVDVSPLGSHVFLQGVSQLGGPSPGEALRRYIGNGAGAARLANISTRGVAGQNEEKMIAGFSVGGSADAHVLVRGVGPTLLDFGLPTALNAARLQLYRGPTPGELNTGWSTIPGIVALTSRLSAFPLRANSADAALDLVLPPTSYTVQLSPATPASPGVALAEIYDARVVPGENWRLVNISTRGLAGVGDESLIAGFILQGEASRQLLIRAVGPTLSDFGVVNAQAAPRIRLMQGDHELLVNEAWDEIAFPEIVAAAATRTFAFQLTRSLGDAAVLVRLPAGAYTAVVSAVGGVRAIALVEGYELSE